MLIPYAIGHFLVDFLCAWAVLGRCAGAGSWVNLALCYNFCAFALQMPLGVLADRWGEHRRFALWGACLVLAGLLPLGSWWTVLVMGLGNGLYHVGGGRDTLLTSEGYRQLGIFVAPGALGIFLGGLLRDSLWAGLLGAALLIPCLWLMATRRDAPLFRRPEPLNARSLGAVGVLFLVVLIRSVAGLCGAAPWKAGLWIPLGAISGALGKALGGFAADRFGGRWAGLCTLALAAGLFLLPRIPLAGVLAGLVFNMSMPITLRDGAARLPGHEGFVFGLMTFALFLGFLPSQQGLTLGAGAMAGLSLLSAAGLGLAGRGRGCNT